MSVCMCVEYEDYPCKARKRIKLKLARMHLSDEMC